MSSALKHARRRPIVVGMVIRSARVALTIAVAAGVLAIGAAPARAATTLSTLAAWDGSSYTSIQTPDIFPPSTVGQTITVPAGAHRLEAIALELRGDLPVTFHVVVFAWDGTQATGAPLWDSGTVNVLGPSTFSSIAIDTGNIPVAAGQQYVIAMTTTEGSSSGSLDFGSLPSDGYAGGTLVTSDATSFGGLTATPWNALGGDLAFWAAFDTSPAPPPSKPGYPKPVVDSVSARHSTGNAVVPHRPCSLMPGRHSACQLVIKGENFTDASIVRIYRRTDDGRLVQVQELPSRLLVSPTGTTAIVQRFDRIRVARLRVFRPYLGVVRVETEAGTSEITKGSTFRVWNSPSEIFEP